MEHTYDFHELLSYTNTLNHLVTIECLEGGLMFPCWHNKHDIIWGKLQPLKDGVVRCDLANYRRYATNEVVEGASKEGLKQAQTLIRIFNMVPSTVPNNKSWFI